MNQPSATPVHGLVSTPTCLRCPTSASRTRGSPRIKLEATKKAKALVAAAVGRVVHQQPLNSLFVPIDPNVLVVGGGITGIQAALGNCQQWQ